MAKHGGGFGGFGGGMNMQAMMQQARKMQESIQKAQEELDATEIEGSSGGGIVKVTVNGNGKMVGVSIEPAAVDPDDIEMLEDLLVAAYSDAATKAAELKEKIMPAGAGGLM